MEGKKSVTVRHDEMALSITIGPKWLSRPVRSAVIEPFVKRFNAKFGRNLDAFGLRCRTVDGYGVEGSEEVGPVLAWLEDRDLWICGSEFVAVAPWGRRRLMGGRENLSGFGHQLAKWRAPDSTLVGPGHRIHELLEDASAPPEAIREEAARWIAATDAETAIACVDGRGRTLLHAAATRGDALLCEDLARLGGGVLVDALDDELNTPIGLAALCGRALVLEKLLDCDKAIAVVQEKNKHLMTPLQLACCEDGVGSPAVARLLVEAGADVNARCWDKTPLMAAAAAERIDLVQTLVEDLGADPLVRNGECMMAADYCRTQDLAELFGAYMDGTLLLQDRPAPPPRAAAAKPRPSSRVARRVAADLETAFERLDLDPALAADFSIDKTTGLDLARRNWRRLVLTYHPDKRPALDEAEEAEWTLRFHQIQEAFELIEQKAATPTLS
ncbi:hypothetical protein CTAYLR_008155 [Chrysophaeum taylorii]|uniref:J domain-containing protein n=1 Tax=Chrysophaeum taylorii TaxID=2483200 RepID=A0AAD7XN37_9STRA|nr:hypothetical protein CTAYLR_008155 [Chrysophaeum taylorii]